MHAARQAVLVLAASHPATWDAGIEEIARNSGIPEAALRRHLATAVRQWDHDPRAVAAEQISDLSAVRTRVAANQVTDTTTPPDQQVQPRRDPTPPTTDPTSPYTAPRR